MICSSMFPAGVSLSDLRPGREPPPWHVYDGDLLNFGPPGPEVSLYPDLPPSKASDWSPLLRPFFFQGMRIEKFVFSMGRYPYLILVGALSTEWSPLPLAGKDDTGCGGRRSAEEVQSSHNPFWVCQSGRQSSYRGLLTRSCN